MSEIFLLYFVKFNNQDPIFISKLCFPSMVFFKLCLIWKLGPSYYTVLEPLPPPINFENDHYFNNFQKLVCLQGQVRLRHYLGRVLRLGQARGPSAAARTGQGADRRGQDRLGSRAPRAHGQLYLCRIYKIHIKKKLIGREESKTCISGNYLVFRYYSG